MPITEWELTADVASWVNEIIGKDITLPFSRAKCEQRAEGSLKRRDLTLLDRLGRAVTTGEIKLPYQKDGSSPYNASVINDARAKALKASSQYFFTWNVNECVLWETTPSHVHWKDQNYKSWDVTKVRKESDLEHPAVIDDLKKWLPIFLNDLSKILGGTGFIRKKSPDEKFIDSLESALKMPILTTLDELDTRYRKERFKSELNIWMRSDQGWIIYDDPEGIRDNLERVARFTCYGFLNKLVFHEALLRRYGAQIDKISVPEHIDTGEGLRSHVEGYFAEAVRITGDYETVFGEDHTSIGNRIPFYSDVAVPYWRELIGQIHEFDFSKLDYEVIGSIFERLISPEERHKFGQFYTRVEVVDLINSFCIRTGQEKILDPACGGGTFLVRAYARKREIAPNRKHSQLLSDLFGVDISHFATHLTTINLATRDLIDEENYPQIARTDFFDIETRRVFMKLPKRMVAKGLGQPHYREIEIPLLDAVVGNPPYIRQEEIPSGKKNGNGGPASGTKEHYQKIVKREASLDLSGRSDIHCYFWPHATTFLKRDGYLCLLTSSQWLDVEYGFHLQEWILRNFEIIAIFESIDEPWFVGARVATTVTILRRQEDTTKRMQNIIRFIQLRRPIAEILGNDGTMAGAVKLADEFRDEILSLQKSRVNNRYRARLVKQGDLWREGVRLGLIMGKSQYAEGHDLNQQSGEYYGGKWGMYLRAPDLWFDLLDETGPSWARLGEIAEVRYGIKSGCDDFFYVKDLTSEYLSRLPENSDFEAKVGLPRFIFESGDVRLVGCGTGHGQIKPIETRFLEPEVHSMMEIDGYSVTSGDCSRSVFLCAENKDNLKGTHALDYISWGEFNNYHRGSTCSSRVTEKREWYDLTGHRRASALWPKERQYRHIAPANADRLVANCRMYEIYPPDQFDKPELWGGLLNSTLVLLSSLQFGRPVGNEGAWSTMVVDVNMMLIPNPSNASECKIQKVVETFTKLKKRNALQFISERRLRKMAYARKGKAEELESLSDLCELDMSDRRELDDAVLELLGVNSKQRRNELIGELYSFLREFFELTRQKEEKAIINKNKSKRRSRVKPEEIAAQVFEEIKSSYPQMLRQYDPDFLDKQRPFDTFELPTEGEPEPYKDLFKQGVIFKKGKRRVGFIEWKNTAQGDLIIKNANTGIRGFVRFPREEDECKRVLNQFSGFIERRRQVVRELIANRTADEEMQEKVYAVIMQMIVNSR
jgi:hypothetical protein